MRAVEVGWVERKAVKGPKEEKENVEVGKSIMSASWANVWVVEGEFASDEPAEMG